MQKSLGNTGNPWETRAFSAIVVVALGAGGREFESPRPDLMKPQKTLDFFGESRVLLLLEGATPLLLYLDSG
jgi:hypothetical protein